MKLPTDIQILNYIYSQYYDTFAEYSKDSPQRSSKIFVPIDITAIAKYFVVDPDIIFGRLYYHLQEKHSYVRPNGGHVSFFEPAAGSGRHCVNFPLLSSILAGLRQEESRNRWAIGIALASLVISIVSIIISAFHP